MHPVLFQVMSAVKIWTCTVTIHTEFLTYALSLQEDLTVKDTNEILNDLKAGRVPKAGPRYDHEYNTTCSMQQAPCSVYCPTPYVK